MVGASRSGKKKLKEIYMIQSTLKHYLFILVIALIIASPGCRKPGDKPNTSATSYDPHKDPLVNPPSLFEPPPDDISLISADDTLSITLRANPNTLNPFFVSSLYDFIVDDDLHKSLFIFNKDMKWRVIEAIVESFEESDDHTEFIVKLKPGLIWHDGRPFTAHDVVYSWQQILDPQVPALVQKPTVEPITECVAIDDLTIKYVQPEPLTTRHWNLLFPIIPKHIFVQDKENHPDLKTGDFYNKQMRHPVGNGPYRIVEWRENDKIVVARWEDYPGRKPYFKKIVFRIIPDDNIAMLSFEKQGVDVVDHLTAQKFARETNAESFTKVGYKGWGVRWSFRYIGWNMDGSNPFFTDKKVRYAMTHACNIQLILEKVYYNLGTRCNGEFHPDSWMFNPDIELLEFDLEKSRALLDQAGWKINPEDGWRYKEIQGRMTPFEFTLLMPLDAPFTPQIAAIFQEDLKKIGVKMKTRKFEWSAFLEKVRKHEFQAEIAGWSTGTDPDTGWNLWRTEEYKKGRNYGGYSNPIIDELFYRGRREFDFKARQKIYQQIHSVLYEDQPYIWLANEPILAVFNKRIHGVQFSPRGIFGFDPSFEGWWTPAGQNKHAVGK